MARRKTTKIVGLTGGIATGKSTVSAILRQMGITVLCADKTAHAVTATGTPAARKIAKVFGTTVLTPSGVLDRNRLAEVVFRDPAKRRILESIVHPAVRRDMLRRVRQERVKKTPLVVLDVPLLFETGFDRFCDATVCVTASRDTQLRRLSRHRGMGRRDALARVKAQMPLREKVRRADYAVPNDGTKVELRQRVRALLTALLSPRGH